MTQTYLVTQTRKEKETAIITTAMVSDESRERIHHALNCNLQTILCNERTLGGTPSLKYRKYDWGKYGEEVCLIDRYGERFSSLNEKNFLYFGRLIRMGDETFLPDDRKRVYQLRGMIEVKFKDSRGICYVGRSFCVWGDTFNPMFGKILAKYRLYTLLKRKGFTKSLPISEFDVLQALKGLGGPPDIKITRNSILVTPIVSFYEEELQQLFQTIHKSDYRLSFPSIRLTKKIDDRG